MQEQLNIYEQGEIPSNMYEDVLPQDKNQKNVVLTNILVDKVEKGEESIDLSSEADKPIDQLKEDVFNESEEDNRKKLSQLLEEAAISREDLLEPIAKEVLDTNIPVSLVSLNDIERHERVIKNNDFSKKLSDSEIKKIAVQNATMEFIAKKLDEQEIFGNIVDFAELMVVDDTFVNHANMKEKVTGNKNVLDYLDTGEVITDLANFGKSLPPEQQLEYNKYLVETYFEDLDHNKLLAFMNSMEATGLANAGMAAAFDNINKLFIGSGIANIPKSLTRGFTKLNTIRRAIEQEKLDAAAVLVKVSENPEIAKSLGVSENDVVSFGNPMSGGVDLNHAIPDKNKGEILARLQGVDNALKKAEDIIDTEIFATDAEKAFIAASIKKKFDKDPLIDNVTVDINENGKGVTASFDLYSDNGTEVQRVTKDIKFTYDDLGGMETPDVNLGLEVTPLSTEIASPRAILGKDKVSFVEQLEANQMARSKKTASYAEAFGAALKGISRKSKDKINNILQSLEGKEIELTYDLLVNRGVGGIRLSSKEYSSILGIRRVYDKLWEENNLAIRSEMIRKGMKGLEIGGIEKVVKVHEDSNSALASLRNSREQGEDWIYVVDGDSSKVVRFDSEFVKKKLDNDFVLVDTDNGNIHDWFIIGENSRTRFALVERKNIKDLPDRVLNKTPNYIPRRRNDDNFYIKELKTIRIGGKEGKEVKVSRTVAWATTRSQAERWVEKSKNLYKDLGESPPDIIIKADREFIGTSEQEQDIIRSFGGQYTGSRSSSKLEYAGDASDESMYINPLDTLQHALQNTADRVTMTAWRQAVKTRWYNEASIYEPTIFKTPFNEAVGVIQESNLPANIKKKLVAAHRQISFHSGVPTKSEQAFQGVFRGIANASDRLGAENFAKYMYRIQDSNPIGLMRSAAYHTTLGMFSLVQLPVQLAGAVVALSVSPTSAPKALAKWLSASVLDLTDNSKTLEATLKLLGKNMGLGDWKKDYDFWVRSGYKDSIRFANADTAAVLDRTPYDAGLLRRASNRFLEIGEMPYKAGELANMRISFFTALEDIKKTNSNFKYTDSDLREVISRAEKMRLNMSAANKAEFQKGLLAITTQFKQIFTKFGETLLIGEKSGGFSRAERLRIGVTQVALFGTAGVPVVSSIVDRVASWYIDEDTPVEEVITTRRGILGMMINYYADVDAAFSGRLTTSSDLIDELKKLITEEAPLYQIVGGVFASSADKWIDSVMMLITSGKILYDSPLDKKTLLTSLEIIKSATLNISASGRKFLEASFMRDHGMLKAGTKNIMLSDGDKDVEDIIARYIGFSSQKAADYWDIKKDSKEYQESLRDVGKFYGTLLRDSLIGNTEDNERMNIYSRIMSEVMISVKNLPVDDQMRVMKSVEDYLDSDVFEGTTFTKWMELQNNKTVKPTIKTNILGRRMLNNNKDGGEK